MIACVVVVLGTSFGRRALCQTRKSDAQHDGFVEKVRTVVTEISKLKQKGAKMSERQRDFVSKWTYDKAGNLVEEQIGQTYRAYHHDGDGNRYERRTSRSMSAPPTAAEYQIQSAASPGRSGILKWVARYDSGGNRFEEDVLSAGYQLHAKFLYRYDDKHRRIEVIYEAQGLGAKRFNYVYDASGRIQEKLEYRGKETSPIRRSQDFQFDSEGNWIKCTTLELRKKGGKKEFVPVETQYRTITYY